GAITIPPGNYSARIKVGGDSVDIPFTVAGDPNYKVSQADYEAQFDFLRQVKGKFDEVMQAIKDIQGLRTQIKDFIDRQGADYPKALKQQSDSLTAHLTAIEEVLHQTKAKSGQDVLNYPIRIDDKLGGVFDMAASGNMAPSRQARDVYAELAAQADVQLEKLRKIRSEELKAFNAAIREQALPVIK
ncbi:MAG: hypothetical protein RL151_1128, partial [Bacteroidota bacterium]